MKTSKNIRKTENGWSVNVFFGGAMGPATTHRTYYYNTRKNARNADISDDIGKSGRVA